MKDDVSYTEAMAVTRRGFHRSQADLDYALEVFGDGLAQKYGWKHNLKGLEAVHYYLMTKYHWTPAQLRSMPLEDLRFALTEEMQGWTLPREAR